MENEALVARVSRSLERLLQSQFEAQGRGLGELAMSVRSKLPFRVYRDLMDIATIRNKVLHEEHEVRLGAIRSPEDFVELSNELQHALQQLIIGTPNIPSIIVPLTIGTIIDLGCFEIESPSQNHWLYENSQQIEERLTAKGMHVWNCLEGLTIHATVYEEGLAAIRSELSEMPNSDRKCLKLYYYCRGGMRLHTLFPND